MDLPFNLCLIRSIRDEFEMKLVHSGGQTIDVKTRGIRCKYKGRPAILGTFVDISHRVRIQAELDRIEAVVENLDTAVMLMDAFGVIRYANSESHRILAAKPEDLTDTLFASLLAGTDSNEIVENTVYHMFIEDADIPKLQQVKL